MDTETLIYNSSGFPLHSGVAHESENETPTLEQRRHVPVACPTSAPWQTMWWWLIFQGHRTRGSRVELNELIK